MIVVNFLLEILLICAPIMAESHSLTGYGSSRNLGRYSCLVFDGDERRYEQWEVKFLGYLKLGKLKATILAPENEKID